MLTFEGHSNKHCLQLKQRLARRFISGDVESCSEIAPDT